MTVAVTAAGRDDVAELAAVAAATFPLACPPSVPAGDVAAFVADKLSVDCFTGYLADPRRRVLVARDGARIVGYAMLVAGTGPDLGGEPSAMVELSKMYVLADQHGSGAAAALMSAALAWAADTGATRVWLGVNGKNERAQRFYRKHGFGVVGTRTFALGATVENDDVMDRRL